MKNEKLRNYLSARKQNVSNGNAERQAEENIQ
jgi:hypothetical protein